MDREDWNRKYAGKEFVWDVEPNRFLVTEVGDLDPGRALDIAAGEGRNAIWLAERGWKVVAVDHSDVGIEKGRTLAAARGVEIEWVVSDVLDYTPTTAGFDLVIVFYLQLPGDPMRDVLRCAAAAVAPGGTFLLVGHHRANLDTGHGGPKSPDVLYTPEQIAVGLDDLIVLESGRRHRPVELPDGGSAIAIDCLVRAGRPG